MPSPATTKQPASTPPLPRFDRFEVEGILGRGAHGTVYLATDTRLHRLVAIKTLNGKKNPSADAKQLIEARMVSGLQHPNIVTLFDAQQQDGGTYLVFEYVDGSTLQKIIRTRHRLPVLEAVNLAIDVARALAYAHRRSTLHCDLKPGNIMVAANGVARVTDFGIAKRTDHHGTDHHGTELRKSTAMPVPGFSGTPSYIAPEIAAGADPSIASDLFSLGIVLYEMLCGTPPVFGMSALDTIRGMVAADFDAVASRNPAIDPKLNQIVMRTIAKNPADRYACGEDLITALDDYLLPENKSEDGDEDVNAAAGSAESSATLEFLLQRMRFKSDFPVLSGAVSAINQIIASDREPTSKLTNIILTDVALTNKILRVINAVRYNRFGGSISTVSRAVSLMGLDTVRNIALSLVLFEHLQNRSQAEDMQDIIGGCFFSSVLAVELAKQVGRADAEEMAICAMFHSLGKLVATFYLHDEAKQIARVASTRKMTDDRAAREVIGVSYSLLGVGVARHWKLPPAIIASMPPCETETVTATIYDREPARVIANCATDIANLMVRADAGSRRIILKKIMTKYGRAMRLSTDAVARAVDNASDRFKMDSATLGLRCHISRLALEANHMAAALRGDDPTIERTQSFAMLAAGGADDENAVMPIPGEIAASTLPATDDQRAQLLAGIQDITDTLAGEYDLNQALRMILETIYRGAKFNRVLLFLRSANGLSMNCRHAIGQDADRMISEGVEISLQPAKTVFYGAISRGADVSIEDVTSPKIAPLMPSWYAKKLAARSMLLMPLMIKSRAIGLIYADRQTKSVNIDEADLRLLRTLRSQAIMAIRLKEHG